MVVLCLPKSTYWQRLTMLHLTTALVGEPNYCGGHTHSRRILDSTLL
jgi:hypothetical protein